MGEEAAQLLVDQVGEDLMELDQEIEKLSLYAGAGSTVSVETVRNVARAGHRASVFRLGDALGRQDAGTALTELRELLTSEHHLPVLAMMVRHFRLLLKAKLIEGSRLSQNEAASELGVPPFAARQYLDQARGLTLADIKKGLIRLQEANLTLISSPAPDRAVMEGLVLDLAGLSGRRSLGLGHQAGQPGDLAGRGPAVNGSRAGRFIDDFHGRLQNILRLTGRFVHDLFQILGDILHPSLYHPISHPPVFALAGPFEGGLVIGQEKSPVWVVQIQAHQAA